MTEDVEQHYLMEMAKIMRRYAIDHNIPEIADCDLETLAKEIKIVLKRSGRKPPEGKMQ